MNAKIEQLPKKTLDALKHIQLLKDGNDRYVRGTTIHNGVSHAARRRKLAGGQSPFAVVLGCSDSRVPVEIVFDQGIGDLFVLRNAGNLVGDFEVEGAEFAVNKFGVGLIVVLGHTHCGAVDATIQALSIDDNSDSHIVDHVRPAIADLMSQGLSESELISEAVHLNTEQSTQTLIEQSELLSRLCQEGKLIIISAEYDLETGRVEFFGDIAANQDLATNDTAVLAT